MGSGLDKDSDEVFMVLSGEMEIEFRDGNGRPSVV